MKKYLLLLLLSNFAIAQVNPTRFEKVQVTNNVISTTAPFINAQETTGVVNKINKADLIDVIEVSSATTLPVTGTTGKIYVTKDNQKIYRWSGTIYLELGINDSNLIHTSGNETKTGKLNLQNLHMYSVEKPVFTTIADSGTAGILSGLYYYDITYYNTLGETEASGELPISVLNKQVTISLPVSSNTSVIGRRIYRTIANPFDSVIKKLVVDIPNNTATSYIDNIADSFLGVALPRMNSTGSQLFNNNERIGFASKISTSFGLNSFLQNTGYANTAFGYGTLTENSIGYRNTAIGVFSMYKNTIGYNNTAMGVHSLNDNTSGIDNTAFGYGTLISNSTGSSNVGVGSNSLDRNLTGNSNVAIGADALHDNLASNNTAVGFGSLQYTTNGTQNTAVGTLALRNNTSGNFNTSVGFNSISLNNGSGNTAVGYGAGSGTVSLWEDNSLFGKQAGTNTVGFRNTIIGTQSGFTGGGSDSVFLGNQSGYYETSSSKLFIDNVKRSSELDARIKALVYGQFDASIANQFLTVNGNLNVNGSILSPSLTGTPTAPTATAGTNTTQLATTAFVAAANAGNVKLTTNQTVTGQLNFTQNAANAFTGLVLINAHTATMNDFRNNSTGLHTLKRNESSGVFDTYNSATASTGDLQQYLKNGVLTTNINHLGEIFTMPPTQTNQVATKGYVDKNRLTSYTVATLPTGTQGDTAFVTNALNPTYLSTVVGGGTVVTPVFYNGTNWVSH